MARPLVLIIDDEDIQRTHLAEMARQAGFRTVEAANGLEALDVFAQAEPHMIVTDYHMPGLDGRSLVARLRRLRKGSRVPIMVITSDDLRRTKIQLLQAGADDFLVKPVDSLEFTARLMAMARRAAIVDVLGTVTVQRNEALRSLEARTRELERLTHGLVASLERASSLNDTDTGLHIQRVSSYAAHLARAHGADETTAQQIQRYAGLHDIGKVGIPDAILKKPGQLSEVEFEQMKTHTLIGAELLREAGLPDIAVHIALYHHERWDGAGYPHGLFGADIPIEARLVAVADVFDAMVTKRVYKDSVGLDEAARELVRVGGTQLDPVLVELFIQESVEIHLIYQQFADTSAESAPWT
ncbi:MAG: HD domain-containing phosphohydrolase [Pseudomonadota bacterium]